MAGLVIAAMFVAALLLAPWYGTDSRDGRDWRPGAHIGGPLVSRWRAPRDVRRQAQ